MLTIQIPESTARISAEDELAKYILNWLKEHESMYLYYFHRGAEVGKWEKCEGKNRRCYAGVDAIKNVIRAFRNKGYIVDNVEYWECSTAVIISR